MKIPKRIQMALTGHEHTLRDDSIFVLGDSRTLLEKIPKESIDCIITSPPYLDMKDYGGEKQIGFGQADASYYQDMKQIFSQLYRVSKKGGALWLVVDNVKRENGLVLLPHILSSIAAETGWKIHDLIVWDKGKSLPWAHSGKLRGVCEQIILLGKGNLTNFNVDAVRDSSDLSPYWIKYPERYNPSGKSPSNLWHFPIPVQGSWSKESIRHDCPFPLELVTRMILLTTKVGDIVLDPFAGSGSVLKGAQANNRRSVSFESSEKYYKSHISSSERRSKRVSEVSSESFSDTIMNLRKNKIAISLFKILSRPDKLNGTVSNNVLSICLKSRSLNEISIYFLILDETLETEVTQSAKDALDTAPLSKYGLQSDFAVIKSVEEFIKILDTEDEFYEYRQGRFYSNPALHTRGGVCAKSIEHKKAKYPPLYSNIKTNIEFVE